MVELGLVLLDLCPGPLVLFVDPRLQDDLEGMVSSALAMVVKFDEAHVRRWRIIITVWRLAHLFQYCLDSLFGSYLRRKRVSVPHGC